MTAVFWGQLSHCTPIAETIAQYSCTNTVAYGAVSAFSVILFLFQSAVVLTIIYYRAEFIEEL